MQKNSARRNRVLIVSPELFVFCTKSLNFCKKIGNAQQLRCKYFYLLLQTAITSQCFSLSHATGQHIHYSSKNLHCKVLDAANTGDRMPLTHGVSKKSFGSRIRDTLPMPLSGRLLVAHQFQVSLKQEGSASLATWHVQIPGKIISKLSVRRSDHQETGGDLEGTRVPPG